MAPAPSSRGFGRGRRDHDGLIYRDGGPDFKIPVGEVMVNPGGHRTEQVLKQRSLSRPPKPYLRVRNGPSFVAGCATVEEVAQLVDLATLIPEQR